MALGLHPLLFCSCSTVKSVPWPPWESQPDTAYHASPKPDTPWVPIGHSIRGRPILAAYSGNGPRRIYVIGGFRGDQPEPTAALVRLPHQLESFSSTTTAARGGAKVRSASTGGESAPPPDEPGGSPIHLIAATVRTIQDANPDAAVLGQSTNTRGVDIDRNWPARSFRPGKLAGPASLSEIETAAIHADLVAFRPDIVVIVRASTAGPVVSGEGPGADALAQTFAAAARETDPRWRALKDRRPIPAGSLLSLEATDLRTPVLTVELASESASGTNARALASGIAATITDRGGPLARGAPAATPNPATPARTAPDPPSRLSEAGR